MATLVCADPQHASRSAEADWLAALGTAAVSQNGSVCPACARLTDRTPLMPVPTMITEWWSIGAVASNQTNTLLLYGGITNLPGLWLEDESMLARVRVLLSGNAAGAALTVSLWASIAGGAFAAVPGATATVPIGVRAIKVRPAFGAFKFAPNAGLQLRYSTPAGWSGTSLNLTVWLDVLTQQ